MMLSSPESLIADPRTHLALFALQNLSLPPRLEKNSPVQTIALDLARAHLHLYRTASASITSDCFTRRVKIVTLFRRS